MNIGAKMKIYAYKAFGHDKTRLLDNLIGISSLSKYSHTELVFSDGLCFSSSGRDDGVRFRELDPHPDRWDIFDLVITEAEENQMRSMAELYVKKKIKYDYIGAVTCGFNLCIHNKKFFCSEIVAIFLAFVFEMDGLPCTYSPGDVVKYIQEPLTRL